MSANKQLIEAVMSFYDDPLGYVMFAFPWDSDPAIQMVELKEPWASRFNCRYGPDKWACEFLDKLGKEIKKRGFDGRSAVDPIRFSTVSGHGIGKSTLVAWLIKFILDTRPFSRGVVTANTGDQLRTKTWPEVGKWNKLSITAHLFDFSSGKGAMRISRKGHKDNWGCDAITWRKENAEAFQGLHAANSTPFFIFDEASGIEEVIWDARAGAATDGEPMTFDFGNPTRKDGRFYENCEGIYKHRYIVTKINSMDVDITNKKLFQEWIDDYGYDHDFVRVKVRGEFPYQSTIQFIPDWLVEEAMAREPVDDRNAPLVIGVDVARFGENESVIYPRIGNDAKSWPIKRYKHISTSALVERVIETIREFNNLGREVNALFIDGGGVGGGVVDQLRALGYNPIEVNFGGQSSDNRRYRRKGDEMWGRMKEQLSRICLPPLHTQEGTDLKKQLCQREYGFTDNGVKLALERKKDMVQRLGGDASPDIADALALTFASEVAPRNKFNPLLANIHTVKHEYDPLEAKW